MEPNAPQEQTPPTNPEPQSNEPMPPQPDTPPTTVEQPSAIANQFQPGQPAPSAATDVATPSDSANTSTFTLPTSWPGAFGAYKFSKQVVKFNVNPLVGWFLIILIVNIVLQSELHAIGRLLTYAADALGTSIATYLYVVGLQSLKVSFGDAFKKGINYWLKIFLLSVLVALTLLLSFLLLIVPFFFVAPRLALANYFLVDKNMSVIEAYKASWHATKGNVGKVYGIYGATLAMALLMITIIGIPFSLYFLIMYSAAPAILYGLINSQPTTAALSVVKDQVNAS